MKKVLSIILIILIIFILTGCNEEKINSENFKITTSFYPMYIIALNLTKDAKNIELNNMTDSSIGCLHNYTLTTNDLKKIQESDILVINGLGLEENILNTVNKTNSNIKVIDSSDNIDEKNIISGNNVNPHIWTSINLYKNQVETISENLINLDENNREIYVKNTEEYINKLNELENRENTVKEKMANVEVVVFSESLEYLIKEMNINYSIFSIGHEESGVSSEELGEIIDEINDKNIKTILIDKEDSKAIANSVSAETGATIHEMDSCLTGELDLDSYITKMNSNLDILENIV